MSREQRSTWARATSLAAAGGIIALLSLGAVGRAAEDAPAKLCDAYSGMPTSDIPHAGMVWIAGGRFTMGDDEERPEERAAHEVTLEGFWIDRHEVTNALLLIDARPFRSRKQAIFS